jgi:hypothetical protein
MGIGLSCSSKGTLKGLDLLDSMVPDSLRVRFGRPPGPLEVVKYPDERALQALERAVLGHQETLGEWARRMTGLETGEFRYMFTVRMKPEGGLSVRYFAGTLKADPIYAGAEIWFTLAPGDDSLASIYLNRVPYE